MKEIDASPSTHAPHKERPFLPWLQPKGILGRFSECGNHQPRSFVLLVAVHPSIENLACHILALAGYASLKAASESEALEWIACSGGQGHYPTVILLDSPSVPRNLDTEYFLSCLRANWRFPAPLPAVIRFQNERWEGQQVQGYVHAVLPKPFRLREFLFAIRTCEDLVAGTEYGP